MSIFPEVSFLSRCWAFSLEACPKRESLSLSPPSPCLGSGFALDSTPHQALAEHRVSAGGPAAALGAEGSKVCLLVPPWGSGGEPSASSCCSRCRLCPRHSPQPWSQKPFGFFPHRQSGLRPAMWCNALSPLSRAPDHWLLSPPCPAMCLWLLLPLQASACF